MMKQHIDLIGLIWMILGGLAMAGGVLGGLAYAGIGVAMAVSGGDSVAPGVMFIVIGFVVAVVVGGLGGFEVMVGRGVRARKPWARVAAMIMGGLGLLNIPIGTFIGGFTIYAMLQDDVKSEFGV
jgi:hypothetical protein